MWSKLPIAFHVSEQRQLLHRSLACVSTGAVLNLNLLQCLACVFQEPTFGMTSLSILFQVHVSLRHGSAERRGALRWLLCSDERPVPRQRDARLRAPQKKGRSLSGVDGLIL